MSTMTDQDKHAASIDGLIRDNLRDWVVQYRASGGIKPGVDIGTENEARSAVKRGRGKQGPSR